MPPKPGHSVERRSVYIWSKNTAQNCRVKLKGGVCGFLSGMAGSLPTRW